MGLRGLGLRVLGFRVLEFKVSGSGNAAVMIRRGIHRVQSGFKKGFGLLWGGLQAYMLTKDFVSL